MPEIKTVITEKFTMDYFSFGHGERTMVILPGISAKPIYLSADAVEAQYSDMHATHTVYVFERKRDIRDGYTVSDMADDTAEAMKILALKNADIFGASQGGMMAQTIAVRYPELVSKLIVASSMARPNPTINALFGELTDLVRRGEYEKVNHGLYSNMYTSDYYGKYRDIFSLLEKQGTDDEMHRLKVLMEACLTFDIYGELDKISCPVLVIGASDDRVLTPEASKEIAKKTGAELYIYENYAHAVYDETPDYMSRIKDFFCGSK